jgi:catechol 2,3-dioxygenase-like lactoylglutathione lyase family enzyme
MIILLQHLFPEVLRASTISYTQLSYPEMSNHCMSLTKRVRRMETEPANQHRGASDSAIEGISAVSLATCDMARAVRFYRALGFSLRYGGERSPFTSFRAGSGYLNLIAQAAGQWCGWGRVIFYVADVDAFYAHAIAAGCKPESAPQDASWGERFFHLTDPDGHELSFARPLPARP